MKWFRRKRDKQSASERDTVAAPAGLADAGKEPTPESIHEDRPLAGRLTLHVDRRNVARRLHYDKYHPEPRWYQKLGRSILGMFKWLLYIKPRLLIIERYIWGECFGYFLLGVLGFTFFMIITSIFNLGEKIFTKNIPPFTIAKVLLLSAPAFIVLAIPVAVVFSTLMGMGRLNRDNELVAFSTNGISLYRIFVPFISIGIFAGLLTWGIYEYVVPPNNRMYKSVLKVFWEAQVVDFIKPGIVIKAPDHKYFYVDDIRKEEVEFEDGTTTRMSLMYDIRLYDYYAGENRPPRAFPRMFVAKRAWVRDKFLVLKDVNLYDFDQHKANTLVCAEMTEIKIDIGTRSRDYFLQPHPTELSTTELRNRIVRTRDTLNSLKFPSPALRERLLTDWTEYYFKYSIPFACLAFVLVTVPVSLRGPRDERNLGIILSFVICFLYYIVFFVSRTLGSRGIFPGDKIEVGGSVLAGPGSNLFPPVAAGWLAPALFLIAAVVLIYRARK